MVTIFPKPNLSAIIPPNSGRKYTNIRKLL